MITKVRRHVHFSTRFTLRILFLFAITIFIASFVKIFIHITNGFYQYASGNVNTNVNFSIKSGANIAENNQIVNQMDQTPLIYQPPSESIILRALLVFYPSDQDFDFYSEFLWFYRSWTEMMLNESSLWRTDLIVYTTNYSSLFKELACSYEEVRMNAQERPTCRVFPYIRIKDRLTNHEPTGKYQLVNATFSQFLYQNLRTYGYIDSINTVFEYYLSYSIYDYILRTDMDCFLTVNFAYYVPYNTSLLVGRGGYSTEFNNYRLKRIAHDMNWQYADRSSLGSTWYGPSKMVHHISLYTIKAMMHLATHEFTTPEREQKVGVMLWPEWHFGVLLLYGGHLAINHLIVSENYNIGVGSELLDQGVTSTDKNDIKENRRLHLHCWHGDEPFSKFAFKSGKYDNISLSSLISDTSASGYAMRMALESKSMKLEQLRQTLFDVKK